MRPPGLAERPAGMFVLVVLIFRWHNDTDEDSWWKGKGKALGRWFSRRTAFGLRARRSRRLRGVSRERVSR